MERIHDTTAAVALPATPALTGTIGYFTEGTPGVTAATNVRAWWLNMVQEELVAVLTAAGVTPDTTGTSFGQLLTSIQALTRIKLSGNLDLYVATTGSDSNGGLVVGDPFLTIAKATSTLYSSYDLNGHTVTIHIAAGTYSAGATNVGLPAGYLTSSSITYSGAGGTTIVTSASTNVFVATAGAQITLQNMTVSCSAANASCVASLYGSLVTIGSGVIFAASNAAAVHMNAQLDGAITAGAAYTVSGGASAHIATSTGGNVNLGAQTVTISGTPAFATAFVSAAMAGGIYAVGSTMSGSATGVRYSVTINGWINTAGAGATFFPGNSGGTSGTGGQYV